MHYATLEDNGYLYVHTVEDHSDDHTPNTDHFSQGYVFSYAIIPMSQASQSLYCDQRVDDFIEDGGSETENFKTQATFDTYVDIIKHAHMVNELIIIDNPNTLTVGELAHHLLNKLHNSEPLLQIRSTEGFTC